MQVCRNICSHTHTQTHTLTERDEHGWNVTNVNSNLVSATFLFLPSCSAFYHVHFISQVPSLSAENTACVDLFISILLRNLTEQTYSAECAQLGWVLLGLWRYPFLTSPTYCTSSCTSVTLPYCIHCLQAFLYEGSYSSSYAVLLPSSHPSCFSPLMLSLFGVAVTLQCIVHMSKWIFACETVWTPTGLT